jgi:hypothetical protein
MQKNEKNLPMLAENFKIILFLAKNSKEKELLELLLTSELRATEFSCSDSL